jgi:tetratricopeptide (TPR) repeat protein
MGRSIGDSRSAWRHLSTIALIALGGGANSLHSAPFVPSDDAEVLERLAERTTPEYRQLKALQAASALAPGDMFRATALAAAHIRIARQEGDPRYLGYAQSALAPWWRDPNAPTPVLVLRATIRQSVHDFDGAVADLGTALQREPRNAQALLTRATVLTVQGKYADAHADCTTLAKAAPAIYVVICIAAIDGVTGKARLATGSLTRALSTLPRIDAASRAYAETTLGEIAHRLGDTAAQDHFAAALQANPRDLYLIGAYSDWLLDQGRPADVIPLVIKETRVDPLVLRLGLAQQALQRPDAAATIEALRAQFDASRARGDVVHRREEARFELHIDRNPGKALALARDNWRVQREPADLRILAEAAAATGDADTLAIVQRWLAETGLEYPAVAVQVSVAAGRNPAK